MLTGRFTYGLGQQTLDAYGMPVNAPGTSTDASGTLLTDLTQTSVAATPIAQWGMGELAIALGVGYVLWSVFSTTRRGVRRAKEFHRGRRERLAREHRAAAEHYKA